MHLIPGLTDMRGHHDLGGLDEGLLDLREDDLQLYERRADAMVILLVGRGYYTLDASRRVAELDLTAEEYATTRYYDRWLVQARRLMTELGVITDAEVEREIAAARERFAGEHENAPAILARAAVGSDHPHDHDVAADADAPAGEYEILEAALRTLFLAKGLFTAAELQAEVAAMEARTPELGARLVAHAWTDPEILARAEEDAIAAASAIGLDMANSVPVRAVANTPDIHHLVVCTLCSCYPRPLLGPPPTWYKSRAYRAKAVIDPRGVLREFGTELPPTTEVRTVDSTADLRYLVIPLRPEGTDDWPLESLEKLVTRDSMIGVGVAAAPGAEPRHAGG